MHKYHIADILTFTRFLCAIGLIVMAVVGFFSATEAFTTGASVIEAGPFAAIEVPAAFLLFAIGELTDAFDGIAARRWPYPKDGKRRRWRNFADRTDIVADITLALATILFIILRVNFVVGWVILLAGAAIAIPIEFFSWYMVNGPSRVARKGVMGDFYWKEICAAERVNRILAERVVLKRRYLYVLGIVAGLMILLWTPANGWMFITKFIITCIGATIGAALWVVKRDRRTEWHTSLISEEAVDDADCGDW